MVTDFVLWRGEWQKLALPCGEPWEYQAVIRRKPRPKKVRPLNAEEWKSVAGCVMPETALSVGENVPASFYESAANEYAHEERTCHPPGFPADVRKLYFEEGGE